ncbi:MAG: hypothetical protein HQL67_01100 [Magnetococcales bacterium]|nr:hypothetical protein [Magnetococcales bacterium]
MTSKYLRVLKESYKSCKRNLRAIHALSGRSQSKKIQDIDYDLQETYLITTDRGVYRLSRDGLFLVFPYHTYGIAIHKKHLFIAILIDTVSIIVRGDKQAFFSAGLPFNFQEVYRIHTLSPTDRIHGMFMGGKSLWVANTARNTILEIDPDTLQIKAEIPILYDSFSAPVLYDQNHINGISEYHGVVLFSAPKVNKKSMIGLYDGVSVTGYEYENSGVHDVYLSEEGLFFCDTFGTNQTDSGGYLVTGESFFDKPFFDNPPGVVVRGLAGTPEEFIIGHSHKGARAKRFKGHGALLMARFGQVQKKIPIDPSQVHQIICQDGLNIKPSPDKMDAEEMRAVLKNRLGEPIYSVQVSPLPPKP